MLSHMSMARIIVKNPVLRYAPVFILRERQRTKTHFKTLEIKALIWNQSSTDSIMLPLQ